MTIVHFPSSKYRNVPTDGYDSQRESRRAQELNLLEKAGTIGNLIFKPKFEIVPPVGGHKGAYYEADWSYFENGQLVVEDSKGYRTQLYKLKKKLMRWRHGIEIRET